MALAACLPVGIFASSHWQRVARGTRQILAIRGTLLAVFVLMPPATVLAHEGPPFPILMDQSASGYRVSVQADPDIGEARFFIMVEGPEDGPPAEIPEVSMWTEPISGRLERVNYEATQQSVQNQLVFLAEPYFDQRDQWTVGFQIAAPGKGAQELTTQVESTPPGYGLWDFVIYLFPFVFLGFFWTLAMRRRHQLRELSAAAHTDQAPEFAATPAKDQSA